MRRLVAIPGLILFSAVLALAQGTTTLQTGYAVVTPAIPSANSLVVLETLVQTRAQDTIQVGVFPPNLTMNALLTVDVSATLSKNLGIAIANPNNSLASINLTVRRADGTQLATTTITLATRRQTAQFITELFPLPPPGGFSTVVPVPSEFTGTLIITSNTPVSILGLNFRGANYSTIQVTDLQPLNTPVPIISSGVGGLGSALFPQFATGGGWGTEFTIANTLSSSLTFRVDLFTPDGAPLTARLNGVTSSSFTNLTVPANGLLILRP